MQTMQTRALQAQLRSEISRPQIRAPKASSSGAALAPRAQHEMGLLASSSRMPVALRAEAGNDLSKAPQDFFLFIKDYGWSLRYRINKATDSSLDLEKPLQVDWVKLKTPVRDPAELQEMSNDDRFDWDNVQPPGHNGFMYQVTRAVGQGVEAIINFFDGRGLNLLVQPDGIRLLGKGDNQDQEKSKEESESVEPDSAESVTHCWVKVLGLPFLPIVQSIAFYNVEQVVVALQA
eukprot:CAMPEP_0170590124 /NCGR_PEP_ID=MMETSP0224-20130122/11702_1 /TAXON_ID=285029 /ORGANISM="Togula jolla, Strain CCCM 725" /LENGTH=233 /DNA_ID=CAMNT_0010913899 /DNA_START=218 /DNA_END=919 /DNA_ORIENTATION=+